jgi:hypothetical protein
VADADRSYHRAVRDRRLGLIALAASLVLLCGTPTAPVAEAALPGAIDDRAFWALVTEFSEPNGYFRSDNLVSNETQFQHVVPALKAEHTPASAYVGVGPDQNFTYLAALKPRIAFIVDVRRQNLLLQLMYKSIIEMSPTRAEFLSRLFARGATAKPSTTETAEQLFAAIDTPSPDARACETNLRAIEQRITGKHRFHLTRDDLSSIEYVYRAFCDAGPDIRYSFGRGPGWLPFPSYRDLMTERDAAGINQSYLANEENYRALRDLEMRNLIVPIVGDFSGPKALRSVGAYLRSHRATVTAFYTSNVEQYLFRDDQWQRFYANVGAMPLTPSSTFIRAVFNNIGMRAYVTPAPYPLPAPQSPPYGPRSLTLLNPIPDLLAAVQGGRVQSYRDVVELSLSSAAVK